MLPARPTTVEPKEVTVDQSIEQLGQDLARAGYAEATQRRYLRTANLLSERFGVPVAELSREQQGMATVVGRAGAVVLGRLAQYDFRR